VSHIGFMCDKNPLFVPFNHRPKKRFLSRKATARFCSEQKGGRPYFCKYCGKWHVTTKKGGGG
jgi:hypothetical protein